MVITKKTVLYIPVDRCLAGEQISIDEQVDPLFLELSEKDEVVPVSSVRVCGKAYRAQEWLVVNANVFVQIRLPCSTCNEDVVLSLEPSLVHQEPIERIDGSFWDMSVVVRELILLEVPFFVHCGGTSCMNYNELKRYFRDTTENQDTEGYQPFHELNLEELIHGSPTKSHVECEKKFEACPSCKKAKKSGRVQ